MSDLYCPKCRKTFTNEETICPNCNVELDDPTKSEHFVPRIYLKKFAFDIMNGNGKLYFYDNIKKRKSSEIRNDKKVACIKDLYELINKDGQYMQRNGYEDCFGIFEGQFNSHYNNLNCIISNNIPESEKTWWITYILLQYIRNPRMIDAGKELCPEFFKKIDPENYHSLVLYLILPFSAEGAENNPLLNYLVEKIRNMEFCVIKAKGLITSDNPVFIAKINDDEWDEILFPVDPETAICLRNPDYAHDEYSSMDINARIVYQSNELYSSYPLTKEYIDILSKYLSHQRMCN